MVVKKYFMNYKIIFNAVRNLNFKAFQTKIALCIFDIFYWYYKNNL